MNPDLNASFVAKNMPCWLMRRGSRRSSKSFPMALRLLFSRGLFLGAFLLVFQVGACQSAWAQPTGPVPEGPPGSSNPAAPSELANSSNYQNAPVNTILDLYEQLSGKHLIRDAQYFERSGAGDKPQRQRPEQGRPVEDDRGKPCCSMAWSSCPWTIKTAKVDCWGMQAKIRAVKA